MLEMHLIVASICILISTLLANKKVKLFSFGVWSCGTLLSTLQTRRHNSTWQMSEFINYNFMYAMCIYKHSLLSLCTKTFICCKMFHIHLNNVLHSMHSPCKYSKLKFNVWTMCKTLPRFRNLKYVNFKMNDKQ